MFLMVNERKFQSWPKDVQKAIEGMEMEHSEWAANLFQKRSGIGLKMCLKSGVKKTEIPKAESEKMLQVVLKPLVDEWLKENKAKGLPAQEWLDEFNKLLKKYNAKY